MAHTQEIKMIPISKIKNKFDVRVALDQDRVIQFAGMYESGSPLPPISVIPWDDDTYAILDGRHRAAGREYISLTDVPAIVEDVTKEDRANLYALALHRNWGGSKPPSRADITHTISRMLENGATASYIKEHLNFLPPGSLRLYITDASSMLNKRRIGLALDAISEGTGIEQASKATGVKVETIKEIITGKKGKWGGRQNLEAQVVNETKTYISKALKSANTGISKKIETLFKMVEDGDSSIKGVEQAIVSWEKHLKRTSSRVEDWKSRLQSLSDSHSRLVDKSALKPEPKPIMHKQKIGPLAAKRLRRLAKGSHPLTYLGVQINKGFWNDELPKAIRVVGSLDANALLKYFTDRKASVSMAQIKSAMERLKAHGLGRSK